jgi:hypothetical protein
VPFRVAAPDRTADATMPVAMPVRPRAEAAPSHPAIIDDGMSVGARLLIWFLAIAIGFGGGYAGYVLATDDSSSPKAAGANGGVQALPIQAATSFDPFSTDTVKDEHPDETNNAIDGDTATFWTTESYKQANVGGKPGVGLILELTRPARVSAVNLAADAGMNVEIYTSDTSGSTLAAWGSPKGSGEGLGDSATVAVEGRTPARYVLVWLTLLPRASSSPDGGARFVGRIAEVSVRGTPA